MTDCTTKVASLNFTPYFHFFFKATYFQNKIERRSVLIEGELDPPRFFLMSVKEQNSSK